MKKAILCLSVYLMTAISVKPVDAVEHISSAAINQASIENYISNEYRQIDFGHCGGKLSLEVFSKAYHGYLALQDAGKLTGRHMLTICDFTKSSTQDRLWIIDLDAKKVVFNTFVAHGQGSGEEFATAFSNHEDSHQSSLGFYVTGDTYIGEHGVSLRLYGMDNGFNDAAYDRGIVVHGANYVSGNFIAGNDRLGRSWGCPAVPSQLSDAIINKIKNGTCLFIYYPQKKYLETAYWLNKKIDHLPGDTFYPNFQAPMPTDTIIEYVSASGKVDSTKTVALPLAENCK